VSDDLDIRGGGAVAVDTATLRAAADRFVAVADELAQIGVLIGTAGNLLLGASRETWAVAATINSTGRGVLDAQRAAEDLACDLRSAAAVYETIELRAERDIAASAGDAVAVRRLQRRLAALATRFPDAAAIADGEIVAHWMRWPAELSRQAPGALSWLTPGAFAMAGPSVWAMQRAVASAGAGVVPRTARLRGAAGAVVVAPIGAVAATAAVGPVRAAAVAPTSLAAAAGRIPGAGESRVRVERYAMPDGSRQFAVYVAGTQTMVPLGDDPFDMRSNVELYAGLRSASYEATLEALALSGAEPGDVVHAFGHSQGGMIVEHLALEGGYDTRTAVTFGSPIEADLGEETLSVGIRHRDDPIVALAGGGHAGSVGAPGSFVAERTADPMGGLHDWLLPAHGIDGYAQTAAMLDESADPRMDAVRAVFDDLGSAESVRVVEYSAQRVSPASADAG
jgi:pimeloyl-ACP methyl ester carboxylesterase